MKQNELEDKVFDCIEAANDYLFNKEVTACFKSMEQAWDILPNPKIFTDEMYLVLDALLILCKRIKSYKLANQLIGILEIADLNRVDDGERECNIAYVLYEQEYIEVAKELFYIVQVKSKKKALRHKEDKMYKDLAEGKIHIPIEQSIKNKIFAELSSIQEESQRLKAEDKFKVILEQWEDLETPKIMQKESYHIIEEIIQECIKYRLYNIANIMMSLLYASDLKRANYNKIAEIAGELAYKQGQLGIAKECYTFAGKDTLTKENISRYEELLKEEDLHIYLNEEQVEYQETYNADIFEEILDEDVRKQIVSLCEEADNMDGQQAIDKYEQALALLPSDPQNWEIASYMYVGIGDVYLSKKKYEEALNNFQDAYNCPEGVTNPYILFQLGICWYELGDIEKSKDYFIRTYMLDGSELFEDNDPRYFELIRPLI